MKKKIVVLTMLLVLLVGLCACGKKSEFITLEQSEESQAYMQKIEAMGDDVMFTQEKFETVTRSHILNSTGKFDFPVTENVEGTLDKINIDGTDVYTLVDGEDYDNVVLYIHGGAWVYNFEPEHSNMCAVLAEYFDAKVYMPIYPLAPWATYAEIYPILEDVYKELLKEGKNVFVMGDSAGGNLALGLTEILLEKDIQTPDRLVLFSPCADATFTNPEIADYEEADPMLSAYGCKECAKMFAGDKALDDPLISPINADLSDFPPTLIIHGTADILYPDSKLLYEKMKDSGCEVTFVEGKDLWHVFVASLIPESVEAFTIAHEFCCE